MTVYGVCACVRAHVSQKATLWTQFFPVLGPSKCSQRHYKPAEPIFLLLRSKVLLEAPRMCDNRISPGLLSKEEPLSPDKWHAPETQSMSSQ